MGVLKQTLSLAEIPVKSVMTKGVKTIEASKPLVDSIRLMNNHDIGSVVVVENDKPVGIFTERDLVRKLASGLGSLKRSMTEIMSRPLTTILPTATIWDAIILMDRNKIRRLPVVQQEKLVGILTQRDVFRLIVSQQNLLLEAVSESLPFATRQQLKEAMVHLGVRKLPTK